MQIDYDELKIKNKGDIRTLWKIYESDSKFYKNFFFKISLYLTLGFIMLSLLSKVTTYDLIEKVVNLSIEILPNLLGFNLGAYILVVGFGSSDVLSAISKPLKGQNKFSFYQKLNGVLGISVIIQVVALVSCFLLNVWAEIQKGWIWTPTCDSLNILVFVCNIIVLFALTLIIIYSFFLLINVVKHVFMFAQTIHFFIQLKQQQDSDDNK